MSHKTVVMKNILSLPSSTNTAKETDVSLTKKFMLIFTTFNTLSYYLFTKGLFMSTASSRPRVRHIVSTGLAMFSMFFGAGNIVFPLLVGQATGTKVPFAIAGLLLTAVGVPFLGLITMIFFEGNYKAFFNRLGAMPGFLITLFIMLLIGPVSAMPRCIALSYSTLKLYIPLLSRFWFSVGSCLVIFAATWKKSRIVGLLGDLLSPLLVMCLTLIVVKGFYVHPDALFHNASAVSTFWYGLVKGYNTMDLLGTFFFSTIIIASLKQTFPAEQKSSTLAKYALQASLLGASLLALVYVGFAYLASYYGQHLAGLSAEHILGTLATLTLGDAGGAVVSAAVALACLTTAITLAAVFAEFFQTEVLKNSVSYTYCLTFTLLAACAFANLEFSQIIAMIEPILIVGYPGLIVMTVCNMLYKKYNMPYIKLPFVATIISVAVFYWAF